MSKVISIIAHGAVKAANYETQNCLRIYFQTLLKLHASRRRSVLILLVKWVLVTRAQVNLLRRSRILDADEVVAALGIRFREVLLELQTVWIFNVKRPATSNQNIKSNQRTHWHFALLTRQQSSSSLPSKKLLRTTWGWSIRLSSQVIQCLYRSRILRGLLNQKRKSLFLASTLMRITHLGFCLIQRELCKNTRANSSRVRRRRELSVKCLLTFSNKYFSALVVNWTNEIRLTKLSIIPAVYIRYFVIPSRR